jgi:superoxide dismutase, Fe-Mn family
MKKNLILLFTLVVFSANLFGQFKLPTLSYEYGALEPHIDTKTMETHHSKHHNAYVTNLNNAIKGTEAASLTIEGILQNISKYPVGVRNNGGGVYNHNMFWSILTPNKNTKPTESLQKAIETQFGGMEGLKKELNDAAMKVFGSGWAWLCIGDDDKLFITSTPNQDNPIMDVVAKKGKPIIGIDVWEHAYYLNYQNRRADYLNNIWPILNWVEISRLYEIATK